MKNRCLIFVALMFVLILLGGCGEAPEQAVVTPEVIEKTVTEYVYITNTPAPTSTPIVIIDVKYVEVTCTPAPTSTPTVIVETEYIQITCTPGATATPTVIKEVETVVEKVVETKYVYVTPTPTATVKFEYYNKKTGKPESWYTSQAELDKAGDGLGKNLLTPFYETKLYNDRSFINMCEEINTRTNGGTYGTCYDYLETAREEVKTVTDVMSYLRRCNYRYGEDNIGLFGNVCWGWGIQNTEKLALGSNCGVCANTSQAVAYLLEDDYDEIGFIIITGQYGHAYNYIKQDGIYYFVDFTDFTSSDKWHYNSDADLYRDWKDRICFWSGTSLETAEATKAAIIHDSFYNGRTKADLSTTEKQTGWIVAVKYYSGNEGVYTSSLLDFCFQSTGLINGININGTIYDLDQDLGCAFPEGIEYHTLYINTTEKYLNHKWVELDPIEIKMVPYYCTLPKGLDTEDREAKKARQAKFMCPGDTGYSTNYQLLNKDEATTGAFLRVVQTQHVLDRWLKQKNLNYSSENVIKFYKEFFDIKIKVK